MSAPRRACTYRIAPVNAPKPKRTGQGSEAAEAGDPDGEHRLHGLGGQGAGREAGLGQDPPHAAGVHAGGGEDRALEACRQGNFFAFYYLEIDMLETSTFLFFCEFDDLFTYVFCFGELRTYKCDIPVFRFWPAALDVDISKHWLRVGNTLSLS